MLINKVKITDIVVLVFLFVTGAIIVFGGNKTERFPILLSVRIVAFVVVFVVIKLHSDYNNKLTAFFRHFYPLIFTAYFYGETGYYNNVFFSDLDGIIIRIEDKLIGFQPSIWFSNTCSSAWFNELMNFSYFSFYLIVLGFSLVLYLYRNEEFEKFFFIIIFSFYSYYLFFVLFPVVGPQFYFPDKLAKISNPLFFGKLVKLIQEMGETPTGAFPSSHVGISWIILIIVSKIYKKFLIIIYTFALLICFSTVYINAHYLVDVIAGFISAPFLYYTGLRIYKNYNKTQGYLTAKPISKY